MMRRGYAVCSDVWLAFRWLRWSCKGSSFGKRRELLTCSCGRVADVLRVSRHPNKKRVGIPSHLKLFHLLSIFHKADAHFIGVLDAEREAETRSLAQGAPSYDEVATQHYI